MISLAWIGEIKVVSTTDEANFYLSKGWKVFYLAEGRNCMNYYLGYPKAKEVRE